MKIILLAIAFLLQPVICISQEINGEAEYIIKESSEDFKSTVLDDPDMDPKMREFIASKMQDELTKTYKLTFTKNLSKFEEVKKVNLDNHDADLSWSPYGIDISIYKNLAAKSVITEKDLMGKIFFVKDSLTTFKWKLTEETKTIGGKRCKKATVIIPVSKEEKAAYEQEKAKHSAQTTQFFKLKEPVAKNITAWYSTDLSVMHGPLEYNGLPGLILELTDGQSIMLCTKVKIESNKTNKEIITLPSKTITKQQYSEISEKKLKEIKS